MADNKPNREQDKNPSEQNVDPTANRDKSMSGQGSGGQTGQNRQSGFGQGSQTGRTDKPIGDPKSEENVRRGEGTARRENLDEDEEDPTGLGKGSSGY
jgi:hypothetical protein